LSTPTDNQIYGVPANQFSPSAGTTLIDEGQQKIKIARTNQQSNLHGSCQSIFSLSQHHPSEEPHHNDFNWLKQQPSCTCNSSHNKEESWATSP